MHIVSYGTYIHVATHSPTRLHACLLTHSLACKADSQYDATTFTQLFYMQSLH